MLRLAIQKNKKMNKVDKFLADNNQANLLALKVQAIMA